MRHTACEVLIDQRFVGNRHQKDPLQSALREIAQTNKISTKDSYLSKYIDYLL